MASQRGWPAFRLQDNLPIAVIAGRKPGNPPRRLSPSKPHDFGRSASAAQICENWLCSAIFASAPPTGYGKFQQPILPGRCVGTKPANLVRAWCGRVERLPGYIPTPGLPVSA